MPRQDVDSSGPKTCLAEDPTAGQSERTAAGDYCVFGPVEYCAHSEWHNGGRFHGGASEFHGGGGGGANSLS